jgi:branched-chain amino acid aminotransferase
MNDQKCDLFSQCCGCFQAQQNAVSKLGADLGMTVERRPVAVEELADFAEVAACGTAVVVTPVGKIVWGDKVFDYGWTEIGPTLKKLYDEMTGIQYGERPDKHNWLVEC